MVNCRWLGIIIVSILIAGCDQSKISKEAVLLNNFILLDPLVSDHAKLPNVSIKKIKAQLTTARSVTMYDYRFDHQGLILDAEVMIYNKKGLVLSKEVLQHKSNHTWDLTKYAFEPIASDWLMINKRVFSTNKQDLINSEERGDFIGSLISSQHQVLYFYTVENSQDTIKQYPTQYPYYYTVIGFKRSHLKGQAFSSYQISTREVSMLANNRTISELTDHKMEFDPQGNPMSYSNYMTEFVSEGPRDTKTFQNNNCAMLDINHHGDWLEKRCQDGTVILRQITY